MNKLHNSTDKPSKTTAKELDTMAIAGIQKYLANVAKLTLGGVDYSAMTLVAALQAEVDALVALAGVKAQFQQKVADTRKVRVKTRALRALLRKYVLTTYGNEALQMLGDFGMKAPKSLGPRTALAKAQAQAKALATRKRKKEALNNASSPPAAPAPAGVVTTPAHP